MASEIRCHEDALYALQMAARDLEYAAMRTARTAKHLATSAVDERLAALMTTAAERAAVVAAELRRDGSFTVPDPAAERS